MKALLFLLALPLSAQTFTLGTAADPCVGGDVLTTATGQTVRWGNFTCTFDLSTAGNYSTRAYSVRLDFVEPCLDAGSCGGNLVSKPGQRLLNVFVQEAPALWNFDPLAASLRLPWSDGHATVTRESIAISAGGKITIAVRGVLNSGVLAAVTFSQRWILSTPRL